jgi:microcystin-dependent protein
MGKHSLQYTGTEVDVLLDNVNNLSGIIVMWSGAINKIPTGWLLCDGTNGTPDLRNRFIVGAGTDYSVGNTGGAKTVTLTEAQMPKHSHSGNITLSEGGAHKHTIYYGKESENYCEPDSDSTSKDVLQVAAKMGNSYKYDAYSVNSKNWDGYMYTGGNVSNNLEGAHSHTGTATIGEAGSSTAHENRPPYYALAYIMKA